MSAVPASVPKYRALKFGITRVALEQRNGNSYLRAEQPLEAYAHRLTDRLLHWAATAPDRTFIARRALNADGSRGDWQHVTYAEALQAARSIGQALLNRKASADRPVAILSENSIEHALMALGALYAGVPYCSVSTAYSLVSKDFDKLKHVINLLTPNVVYASDMARYGDAIDAVIKADCEVVTDSLAGRGRKHGHLASIAEWRATAATAAVDEAMQRTGPDTIAKFLFTSGSTKLPKGVINTQRMWCANQQQMRQCSPKRRRCLWTGCRGITPLVATTTLGLRSTTAARSTSTMASLCRP
jgi:feruloyl-CoA synthase